MICDTCGIDHHAADGGAELPGELADAIVEAAEIEAAADIEQTEQRMEDFAADRDASLERNADDNDTAEAIAEIQADAAVEIAQAQAAADVGVAEALADALTEPAEPVDQADDDGGELAGDEPAGEVQSVELPPQLDEPAARSEQIGGRRTQTVSAFRARRPRR